jgi:ubiquinone/menaquinone biosynthesis C-methylase UbiE
MRDCKIAEKEQNMASTNPSDSNERWEKIADFWDKHTHSGNEFYLKIVAPMATRLLQVKSTHRVLEIACSSGLYSRELAKTAEHVVGTDVSKRFIQLAKERSDEIKNLEFSVMDVTQIKQIKGLGEKKFNAAVCNMAIMDLPEIDPLFEGLRDILEKDSHFVVTLLHPCFNDSDLNFFIESGIQNNRLVTTKGIKISHYLSSKKFEQVGIAGQPTFHYFFHRPLQEILMPAFKNGWVLDALEEQTLPYEPESMNEPLSRQNFPEIPAVLGLRFKLN